MTEPRLKTELWIQSQIRLCDIAFIPIAVVRRGDPDAGTVLLRLLRGGGRSLLLKRAIIAGGIHGWMVVAGTGEVDAQTADAYVAREVARDDDLWVVEIEDPKQRYAIDGPVST